MKPIKLKVKCINSVEIEACISDVSGFEIEKITL